MRVAVVQATWTPHSSARSSALQERLAPGDSVETVTVAGSQSDYSWGSEQPGDALFPEREYWDVPARHLKAKVREVLSTIAPDAVVLPGWAFKESLAGLGWAIAARVPAVLVSDSQAVDHRRRLLTEWGKRPLVGAFRTALVGGAPHVRYLGQLGFPSERCYVGCDVVDNEHFASGTPASGDGSQTLLSCIRLLDRKNVPFVLEVLARAPAWRWVIAGDGPERPRIERLIADLRLRDRVELRGPVAYGELPALYRSADVYIQPSLSEPWGLAVNEAMAAGLPVLVSERCGCHEDLVSPGLNGRTFDPTDPASLTSALQEMTEERQRWAEMGEVSRSIVAGWGLDLYATNLLAACSEAIALGPQRRFTTRAMAALL